MRKPSQLSPEARYALRAWLVRATTRYNQVNAACVELRNNRRDIVDFAARGSKTGRHRAFEKLRRRFHGLAFLEGVRIETMPIAVWAAIKPREPVRVEPDDPSFSQDCVTIDYLIAGTLPEMIGLADGLWTLEVPHHALGRMLQREPEIDVDATLLAAHHAVLNGRPDMASFNDRTRRFLVRAGPGAFVCSGLGGPDVSANGALQLHIFAHTWLHCDQLYEDQEAAAAEFVAEGDAADKRLGQGLLLPMPLRRLVAVESNRLGVEAWTPGLPETLAATRGSA